MSRILVCAFLAFAWVAAGQNKPVDTIDPETVRAAQQKLAEKSAPVARDAESLRIENERLRVELAAVRKELAELRKSLGLPLVNAKGKVLTPDERVKAYIAEHPDLKPEVLDALKAPVPIPGMTLDGVRAFAGKAITVREETVDAMLVTIEYMYPNTTGPDRWDAVARKSDGMILKLRKLTP